MGFRPDGSFNLFKLVTEKNVHIAKLELEIQAFTARTSQLQSRLMVLLDENDTLRARHALELASEVSAKERLNDKLDRYVRYVKDVEAEKDDLKDAVTQLVQKVVTSLKAALNAERRMHATTRKRAEEEILSLHAKLARREAELETCVTHMDHNIPMPELTKMPQWTGQGSLTPTALNRNTSAPSFSPQEAIDVLEITNRMNKQLEMEVKNLLDRLERARSVERVGSPESPQLATHNAKYNRNKSHAGTSDVVRTHTAAESHTIGRSSSDSSPAPGGNVRAAEPEQGSARTRCVNAAATSSSHLSATTVLEQLNDLVQSLALGIDAFQAERQALGGVLRMRKEMKDIGTMTEARSDTAANIRHVEEENMSLIRSVMALRHELDITLENAQKREEQLHGELQKLLGMSKHEEPIHSEKCESPLPIPPPTPSSDTLQRKVEEDVDDGLERSMELATPLLPMLSPLVLEDDLTVTLDNHVSVQLTHKSVPNSPSDQPRDRSLSRSSVSSISSALSDSYLSNAWSPPTNQSHPREPADNPSPRIESLEQELWMARRQLQEQDVAIADLRQIVEILRPDIEEDEQRGRPGAPPP